MTKHKLVLCEKPSVGNTVAKVLGIKGRKDGERFETAEKVRVLNMQSR